MSLKMAAAFAAPEVGSSSLPVEAFPMVTSLFMQVMYGFFFLFRITSGSPKMRCRDGGRWYQLAFQFHQQINEIKFKKDTIVFSLSVLIKKKKVALNGFVFHVFISHIASGFCNYVEEELSLFFNLVSLQ